MLGVTVVVGTLLSGCTGTAVPVVPEEPVVADPVQGACELFNLYGDALQADDGGGMSSYAAAAASAFSEIQDLDPEYVRFSGALDVAAGRDGVFDDLQSFIDLVTLCTPYGK